MPKKLKLVAFVPFVITFIHRRTRFITRLLLVFHIYILYVLHRSDTSRLVSSPEVKIVLLTSRFFRLSRLNDNGVFKES
jgi:hypothetical protein